MVRLKDISKVKLILVIGLLCLSFPAILIRYADAPSLVIAFWRKALAALFLIPVIFLNIYKEKIDIDVLKRIFPFSLGTGFLLACHFASWITSVQMTSVASALVLACTQPIWAAILGVIFLREKIPPRSVIAIILSLCGIVLIAMGDWKFGGTSLKGDILALLSGMCAAGYLTVGRHIRKRIPLIQWMFSLYAIAGIFLGSACIIMKFKFTGYNGRTWLMFILLALIPSTLGHNLINYAIRHIEAYKVSLSILIEPVVSTILAAILFYEYPGPFFYLGACFTLFGVWLALHNKFS